PALIAQLRLRRARLCDLTDRSVLAALGETETLHTCEWRQAMDEGEVPATHRLRKKLLADGVDGVIYPSFMSPGGTCVALWRWNANGAPDLEILDPDGRMPRTAASWL